MIVRRVVLACLLMAGGCLTAAQVAGQSNSVDGYRQRFVGAWKLISVETIKPNGEVIYPFYGKNPEGLLAYDASGWMSVQIVSDPHPTVPKADSREDFMAAPPGEKVRAIEGYYAYYGTWTADAANQTVIHHIEQSLYPGERGEAGTRHVVFEGNRLILTAKTHEMGEEHQRKLVWERVLPNTRN